MTKHHFTIVSGIVAAGVASAVVDELRRTTDHLVAVSVAVCIGLVAAYAVARILKPMLAMPRVRRVLNLHCPWEGSWMEVKEPDKGAFVASYHNAQS